MAVVEFNLTRRFPYAGGQEFGDTGAYEQIDAVLTFAVDPSAEEIETSSISSTPHGTKTAEYGSQPISRW